MSFASLYRLSSYLLIAAGFLALVVTGVPPPVTLTVFACAFIASCFVDTAWIRRALPGWVWQAMLLACLAYASFDIVWLSHSVRQGALQLLLLTAAIKLLSRATDRDYIYLYVLSLGALLIAATMTIDLVYLVCLILFLAAGTSSLILYEMNRSSTRALTGGRIRPVFVPRNLAGTGFELFVGFPAKSMTTLTLALTFAILLLATPLFFLLPRVTLGNRHPAGRAELLSGFAESVELGTIGRIHESDKLVMRVKVDGPSDVSMPDLKWRGIALDQFDGRSWSRGRFDRNRIATQGGFFKLQQDAQGTDIIVQTFLLQPMATDVVFGSPRVLAVSRDLGGLERDSSDNIYSLAPRMSAVSYSVVSDVTRPDPRRFASYFVPPPKEIEACCLQVPGEDPRVAGLARTVTADARSPYEKALALESFLRSNYRYSLDLSGTPHHPDPLSMFLFDVQRGHCEYFASAMAIMLRQLGIPARLVNGFRAGTYNAYSGHWTVRQRNAHSWVEAWFPPYGWVEFDPTPPESDVNPSTGSNRYAGLLDALDFWWTDRIVNYDIRGQSRLLKAGAGWIQSVKDTSFQLAIETGRRFGNPRFSSYLFAAAVILAFVATVILVVKKFVPGGLSFRLSRYLRSLGYAPGARDANSVIAGFYGEALSIMEDRGLPRKKTQTPQEFAQSLASESFGREFARLTEMYYRVRFGRILKEGDLASAREILHSLRQ